MICSVWLWHGSGGLCRVTVMGNMNTVAVATLADAACIVLAENAAIPEECIRKAADEGVAVYRCDEPIFETAKRIDALL